MSELLLAGAPECPTVLCNTVIGSGNPGDHQQVDQVATLELLANTRIVEVQVEREAIEELRSNDPPTAERLDAAFKQMPKAGDVFEGFALLLELGHGAFGRVFLARQKVLADRLVALKIAADLHGESQNLAQLQHTNIVPIYSKHRLGSLQAVCMPFFGSATLADVCKNLSASQTLPTSGRQLVSTLLNRQSTVGSQHELSESSKRTPISNRRKGEQSAAGSTRPNLAAAIDNLSKIEHMSYVDAVLWMASRLADGLAHAHERGIIHRDLKPANVLLCDDGQPMLLDFNLAEDVKSNPSFAVAQMGGTPPYMSPEQLIAYQTGEGKVDGRGDIYALGLIIYHLLTGRHAFTIRRGPSTSILPQMIADRQGPLPVLRAFNRSVSPAVESLVQHCLEPNPANRYATARELAEDIERHRTNLPLRHAREVSLTERAKKWMRRHPRLASPPMITAMIAAAALFVAALGVRMSLDERARDLEIRHDAFLSEYHEFESDFKLAEDLLTSDDPQEIREGLRHGEKALRNYDVVDHPEWFEQPRVQELSSDDRARLKSEVGQIAFLMARAIHFQPNSDCGQALRMNELAERHLDDDSKPALTQQRAALKRTAIDPVDQLRLRQLLENAAGLNARGRFLLACEHAAQSRYGEALRILDGVVVEDPNDFGAWSLKARCHQMLDQDAESIAAYGTAIALRPNYARSYLYRATVLYNQQTRMKEALQDLNQALRFQPNLLEAHIDRGLVLFRLNQFEESLRDLDWALEQPEVPSRVWFIRSRVRLKLNDVAGAERDHLRGLRTEPTDHLSWVSRGMMKLPNDVEGALADFIKGEEAYPRCIEALNNQAFVYAVKLKRPKDAIAALDRLLVHFPGNSRALGYRAILLARNGQIDEAIDQARQLIKATPSPENFYRAACVMSLASQKNATLRTESLRLLADSLKSGWGHDLLETDHDLDAIRDTPEFKQFAAFSRAMRIWSTKGAQLN